MLDKFRETAITWDKANRKVYEPLRVSAGDNKGRKLSVQVVNDGVVENITGSSLSLFWETRDKAHRGLDVFTEVDATEGEFEIYYTTGMLSNEGVLNAKLVLVDTSGRVVSEPFTITVFGGIDDDAIQSSDSFTALTEALVDISNLEQNYTPKLNDLTAQLQQTEQSLSSQLADKAGQSAVSGLDKRIDNLVIPISPENANLEVTDAHVSVERNKDFGSLTNRFESLEQVTKPYLENLIHNGDFSKGTEGWVNTVGSVLSATNNTLKITADGTNANPQATYASTYGSGDFFVRFKIKVIDPNKKIQNILSYIDRSSIDIRGYEDGSWTEFSQMYSNVNMSRLSILWRTGSLEDSVGTAVEIKDVVVVDLNAMANGQQTYDLLQMREIISQFPNKYFDGIASFSSVINAFAQLDYKYKTTLNVKGFGAVGDGVTDDSVAITTALLNGAGKTVIFPEGTYKITRTLFIESDTHVKFSPNARLILGDDYQLHAFKWRNIDVYGYIRTRSGSKNITIENLRLTGNKTQFENKTHYGLVVYNSTNCVVRDCEIDYVNYDADTATTSSIMGYCLYLFGSNDVTVTGGRYEYGGYECIGLEDTHNILIEGVYSGTSWRTSLQLHRGCTSIKIINNYIEQNNVETGHAALTLHGGDVAAGKPLGDILISGNTIIADVFVDDIRKGAICSIGDGENNVRVVNNEIISNNFGITVALGNDWDISHNNIKSAKTPLYMIGWDIRISKNQIKRTSTSTLGHAITFTDRDTYNILIDDNYIEAPYTKGILSSVDIDHLKIKGNTILSSGECIALYGGRTSNMIIDGNDLESTNNHGVYLDNSLIDELVEGGMLVANNIIVAAQNAILLNTYVNRPIITGNSVLSGAIGIRVAKGVDYALISLNDFSSSIVKTKLDSGTNHLVVNNLV